MALHGCHEAGVSQIWAFHTGRRLDWHREGDSAPGAPALLEGCDAHLASGGRAIRLSTLFGSEWIVQQ